MSCADHIMDRRARPINKNCIDCGCLIKRGFRGVPWRDAALERPRQEADAAEKREKDKA